jgi:DNA-binding transcriptional ArsR family regulator
VNNTGLPVSEEFRIDDLKTLRVLAHSLRLAILDHLAEPGTVTELAEGLGVSRTRLYRHVHALEEVGALVVVETRQVRGFTESVYQTAARRFVPGPGLLTGGSSQEVVETVLGTIFDITRSDLAVRLMSGELSLDQSHSDPRTFGLARQTVRLSPTQAAAAVEALEEMVAAMPDDPDGRRYCLQYVFYPTGETLE